jgi:hypothetical protein
MAGDNWTVIFLLFMLREMRLTSFENYATSGACEPNRLHTLYLQGAISVAGALQSALLPTAECTSNTAAKTEIAFEVIRIFSFVNYLPC